MLPLNVYPYSLEFFYTPPPLPPNIHTLAQNLVLGGILFSQVFRQIYRVKGGYLVSCIDCQDLVCKQKRCIKYFEICLLSISENKNHFHFVFQKLIVDFYIDIHAHSTLMNGFMYGNTYEDIERHDRQSVFPKLLCANAEDFSMSNTNYNRDAVKAGTGRR